MDDTSGLLRSIRMRRGFLFSHSRGSRFTAVASFAIRYVWPEFMGP